MISRAHLRFTGETPAARGTELAERLSREASYHLTVHLDGLAGPEPTARFLHAWAAANPFSILDLILETGSPREVIQLVEMTDALALSPVPCFALRAALGPEVDPEAPAQVERTLLCPAEALPRMADLPPTPRLRRWARLDGSMADILGGAARAHKHGFRDGYWVRTGEVEAQDRGLLLLYLHIIHGEQVTLRFEDPYLEVAYRALLRRRPIEAPAFPRAELRYEEGAETAVREIGEETSGPAMAAFVKTVTEVVGLSIGMAIARAEQKDV